LADPTRRAILARVASGDTPVGELAAPFDLSLAAISKHLKVLERAGLIARSRDAQRRPCRLTAEPLEEAASWIAEYRRHWEQSLSQLNEYLQELHAGHPAAPDQKAQTDGRSAASRRPAAPDRIARNGRSAAPSRSPRKRARRKTRSQP
jgi:DNA-binding transcriptional ArsR family regulator